MAEKNKTYSIATMGGDGTGPEVLREGVKVLQAIAPKYGIKFDFTDYDFGGERYMRTNEVLPPNASAELRMSGSLTISMSGVPLRLRST